MKRIFFTAILVSLSIVAIAQSQSKPVFERTYISTDKTVYVSGDRIWCSAFCIDIEKDKLSSFSSTAYLELVTDGNAVQTAKVALEAGRGSGYLDIPESTPTGNYRLVAYTAVNKNEEGLDLLDGSKVISILNPYNNTKLKGKVEIVSDDKYNTLAGSLPHDAGQVKATHPSVMGKSSNGKIQLTNEGDSPISVSVSVYHDDGIIAPQNKSMEEMEYSSSVHGNYVQNVLPDFEGEVIYAKVIGKDSDKIITDRLHATGYISSPGCLEDTYVTAVQEDGTLAFKTYNIYGDKDLVCEIADMTDESLVGSISLESPFVSFDKVDVPNLILAEKMGPSVIERGVSMQLFNRQYADSLRQFVGRKENMPYLIKDARVYELDDYTRFPTVKEVLVEIIQEARVRGRGDKTRIQVLANNSSDAISVWKTSLVLIDGVPVFKHADMMDYDAMLLKAVEIWPASYFFASKMYDGVINFVSKSGNMAYMDFASNVKILDFKGACYPMDYSLRHNPSGESDSRQTILWKPEILIAPEEEVSVDCLLPSYSGSFDIVIEGITSDGKPIYKRSTIIVE